MCCNYFLCMDSSKYVPLYTVFGVLACQCAIAYCVWCIGMSMCHCILCLDVFGVLARRSHISFKLEWFWDMKYLFKIYCWQKCTIYITWMLISQWKNVNLVKKKKKNVLRGIKLTNSLYNFYNKSESHNETKCL